MSDDLKVLFEASHTPAPRADLAERIMANAPPRATNDNHRWARFALPFAAIAATLMAGAFVLLPAQNEDAQWEQYAETAGFAELYAWVEGDEG